MSLPAKAQLPGLLPDDDDASWRTGASRLFAHTRGTRFETLEEIFTGSRSSIPHQSDVRGWHSGRCFTEGDQNHAINGLLVGHGRADDDDDGPLFPPSSRMRIFVVNYPTRPADFLDVMSSETRAQLQAYVNDIVDEVTPVTQTGTQMYSTSRRAGARYSVRLFDDFLIVQTTATVSGRGHREGDVASYCYFFLNND